MYNPPPNASTIKLPAQGMAAHIILRIIYIYIKLKSFCLSEVVFLDFMATDIINQPTPFPTFVYFRNAGETRGAHSQGFHSAVKSTQSSFSQ